MTLSPEGAGGRSRLRIPANASISLSLSLSSASSSSDSASLRQFNLLRMLRARGAHVAFLPTGLAHAGAATEALQRLGVETWYSPFARSAPAWLRDHATAFRDDLDGTPEVRQFPGGASNLTYLLRYPGRDLILRRPPSGVKAASAHDMGREYRIQSALEPVFPYVATMVGLCTDESVIGSEFYVMERLDGTILRRELPFDASPEDASKSRPENTSRPPLTHLTPRPESRILPFHSPLEIDGYRSRILGRGSAAGRLSVWRCHWNDSISRNLMQHTIGVCKPSGQPSLTVLKYRFRYPCRV